MPCRDLPHPLPFHLMAAPRPQGRGQGRGSAAGQTVFQITEEDFLLSFFSKVIITYLCSYFKYIFDSLHSNSNQLSINF